MWLKNMANISGKNAQNILRYVMLCVRYEKHTKNCYAENVKCLTYFIS